MPGFARKFLKAIIPLSLRNWLRPWRRDPKREIRSIYYDRYFRGGVVTRNGFTYRLYPHDVVGRDLYVGGHPAGDELQILMRVAAHSRSFLDVGGNIGSVTIPLAKSFAGPILAMEPVSKNVETFRENLKLNSIDDRVRLRRAAIGRSNGTIHMQLSLENSGDHRAGVQPGEGRQTEPVELRTLPDCVAEDGRLQAPFLVKMDVQGFEGEVLTGASSFLKSNPCLLLMEFWPGGLLSNGFTPSDIFGLLDGAGLRVYELTRPPGLRQVKNAKELQTLAVNFPGEGFCNLIATNRTLEEAGLADLKRN